MASVSNPLLPPPLPSPSPSSPSAPVSSTPDTTSTSSSSSSTTSSTSSTTSTIHTTSSSTTVSSTTSSTSSSSTTSSSSSSSTTSSTTSAIIPTPPDQQSTVTRTAIVTTTPTNTLAAPIPQGSAAGSNSFFKNSGEVAGVFTVVGLVALVFFIALTTNAIRRRRAKRFDEDVAKAAAEAAATAHAPIFLDDPEDDGRTYHSGGGGFGTGGYAKGYSDNSHGTYGQPPMHETYGMSEMHHHQPYDAYAVGTGVAGAAGVGAVMQRARSLKGMHEQNVAMGMAGYDTGVPLPIPGIGERQTPYPAFAGPAHDGQRYRPAAGKPDFETLDAAGLGAVGAAAMGRPGLSQQAPRNDAADVSRSRSQGLKGTRGPADGYYSTANSANSHPSVSPTPVASANESYAAHYAPGYRSEVHRAEEEDAYDGYTDDVQPHGQSGAGTGEGSAGDPFSTPSRVGDGSGSDYSAHDEMPVPLSKHVGPEESRMSFRDEEDYEAERGKRILKIANE